MTKIELAQTIEHTILKAGATEREVRKVLNEVEEFGFWGACVNPIYVKLARKVLSEHFHVITVVNFPLGASTLFSVCEDMAKAFDHGADEIDIVAPLNLAKEHKWDALGGFFDLIRDKFILSNNLKVILETGLFTHNELYDLVDAVSPIGFLKTSTGFGPRGASVTDIQFLSNVLKRRENYTNTKIKASGGIKNTEQAISMIEAGASRIGTSSGVEIIRGLDDKNT